MNVTSLARISVILLSLFMLTMPALVQAEDVQTPARSSPPPIGQQLIREGTFAVKLGAALGVVTTDDEIEAETRLGDVGIVPRNGWIADYPVTPDIIGELRNAVASAADADKISMTREEALKRLKSVETETALQVTPQTNGKSEARIPTDSGNYPEPTEVNNYYYTEGPPVVTYYTPPADYYYLYAWVPFPFWCYGFWFPGYFILNDFHRTVVVRNRVEFISNHFNDVRVNRVFRIDPVSRFRGRTYAGIGVTRSRGFISTGVPRSDRTIFNRSRTRYMPGGRTYGPLPRYNSSREYPSYGGERSFTPSYRGGGMRSAPYRGEGGASERRRER